MIDRQPEVLVSILTPTFNSAAFIDDCIQSIQAQTHTVWEQIIVDDGSTDRTPEIVERYARADQRIRLIRERHRGASRLAETYNVALDQATGAWIAILEGDDFWLPSKLEAQLAVVRPRTIFSYGSYLDLVDGQLIKGPCPPFVGSIDLQAFTAHVLMHRSYLLAVTQLIRRDALLTIGGFHQDDSPAAVDMATLLRLVRLPGEAAYLPQPLGIWRHHPAQSTSTKALELARFNGQLALAFFDDLSGDERRALGLQRGQIVHARHAQLADTYFGLIRDRLRRGEREGLAELISGLWRYGGVKRKLQAIYALGASRLGFDFEPILITATWFAARCAYTARPASTEQELETASWRESGERVKGAP